MERIRALAELLGLLWRSQRMILAPLLIVLALLSLLLIVSEASAVAPFLYPLY